MNINNYVNNGEFYVVEPGGTQIINHGNCGYHNEEKDEKTQKDDTPSFTREERFTYAVRQMTEQNYIVHKADWIMVKLALEENKVYEHMHYTVFAKMLQHEQVPEYLLPSDSTLTKIIAKRIGQMQWQIEGKQPDEMTRLNAISALFMEAYREL